MRAIEVFLRPTAYRYERRTFFTGGVSGRGSTVFFGETRFFTGVFRTAAFFFAGSFAFLGFFVVVARISVFKRKIGKHGPSEFVGWQHPPHGGFQKLGR